MKSSDADHIDEVAHQMRGAIEGEVRTDLPARILYSTDASIYQIEPRGVVFPRSPDELQAVVEICAVHQAPVLARGSGSSLAGQAIGPAWIVDCSRYLDRLVEIDPEQQTALVEPGLILNALNREAGKFGLQFGPDPASAERASMGGSIANNAAGAHSICYGMSVDHLMEAEVVLADGSLAKFSEVSGVEAAQKAARPNLEGAFYRAALQIRRDRGAAIREGWPRTWRRASGYNLNYLLPWTPAAPPRWPDYQTGIPYPPVREGALNLAHLIAGSEGTLGVIRRMKIRLAPKPAHTILAVLAFPGIVEACEETPRALEHGPAAAELIPQSLIRLAHSVPAYASQSAILSPLFVDGKEPPALLVVEFSGDDPRRLREKASRLAGTRAHILAETKADQQKIWGIRKVGLGLFMSRAGDEKPWSFIEDLSVPVERLGEYVGEFYRIMDSYGVKGENYGHASAGCLHIRPVVNLKTVAGVEMLRRLASEAVELTLRLGGSVSGEHGDGLSRSEWGERMFGREIIEAFRLLKRSVDPHGILNPGKIVGFEGSPVPQMDRNLRFGVDYRSRGWTPVFDYSRQAGLEGAIEQCNGAGVCRKQEGVMCPSFQATRDEMHSTRGRANLLRAMITGKFPTRKLAEETVKEALDLCLACKGCKAECPSAVDMAKLKYEFFEHYYGEHRRRLRDYLFGYIGLVARLSQPIWFMANPILGNWAFLSLADRWLGLSREHPLPRLARRSLRSEWKSVSHATRQAPGQEVLFLSDPFTEYFYPETGLAALRALELAGCQVRIIPVTGSGRTLISKGFVSAAQKHAQKLVEAIYRLDPQGERAIVGVEPSEILTLSDEYLDLIGPNDPRALSIARRSYSIEEYLVRPSDNGETRILRIANILKSKNLEDIKEKKSFLHGHCYQKARPPHEDGYPIGAEASRTMLEAVGYQVKMIDSGCCGMAGAFGYETEHKHISMQVGEIRLLPAVRAAGAETAIAAAGVSCRSQIEDGSGRKAFHPIELLFHPPGS